MDVNSARQNQSARRRLALAGKGVHARRWWGDGCHRAPAFAGCLHSGLSETDRLAGCVVGLPFHAGLMPDDIAYVVDRLEDIVLGTDGPRLDNDWRVRA